MGNKLTDKQRAFVLEYIKDLNATQAALRAGYAKSGATVTASRLLANANIQEELDKAVKGREKRTQIDADYVLTRLAEIDQMDARDIIDDEQNLLPIAEWPKIWRQMISGFDIKVLKTYGEDETTLTSVLQKIKWPDKIKNLELIGKHVDVGAWRERHELTGKDGGPIQTDNNWTVEFINAGDNNGKS